MRVHSHLHKRCNTTALSQHLISVVSDFPFSKELLTHSLGNNIGTEGTQSLAQVIQQRIRSQKENISFLEITGIFELPSTSLQKWFHFAFTENVKELQNSLNEGISINTKLPWV